MPPWKWEFNHRESRAEGIVFWVTSSPKEGPPLPGGGQPVIHTQAGIQSLDLFHGRPESVFRAKPRGLRGATAA